MGNKLGRYASGQPGELEVARAPSAGEGSGGGGPGADAQAYRPTCPFASEYQQRGVAPPLHIHKPTSREEPTAAGSGTPRSVKGIGIDISISTTEPWAPNGAARQPVGFPPTTRSAQSGAGIGRKSFARMSEAQPAGAYGVSPATASTVGTMLQRDSVGAATTTGQASDPARFTSTYASSPQSMSGPTSCILSTPRVGSTFYDADSRSTLSSGLGDEAMLRLAVEASPTAMLAVDAEGVIFFANRTACAMFGYERKELKQQKVRV